MKLMLVMIVVLTLALYLLEVFAPVVVGYLLLVAFVTAPLSIAPRAWRFFAHRRGEEWDERFPEAEQDCWSCGEVPPNDCPESKRPCGHHCNHSWTHDHCDWCGKDFGEEAA